MINDALPTIKLIAKYLYGLLKKYLDDRRFTTKEKPDPSSTFFGLLKKYLGDL